MTLTINDFILYFSVFFLFRSAERRIILVALRAIDYDDGREDAQEMSLLVKGRWDSLVFFCGANRQCMSQLKFSNS